MTHNTPTLVNPPLLNLAQIDIDCYPDLVIATWCERIFTQEVSI